MNTKEHNLESGLDDELDSLLEEIHSTEQRQDSKTNGDGELLSTFVDQASYAYNNPESAEAVAFYARIKRI